MCGWLIHARLPARKSGNGSFADLRKPLAIVANTAWAPSSNKSVKMTSFKHGGGQVIGRENSSVHEATEAADQSEGCAVSAGIARHRSEARQLPRENCFDIATLALTLMLVERGSWHNRRTLRRPIELGAFRGDNGA